MSYSNYSNIFILIIFLLTNIFIYTSLVSMLIYFHNFKKSSDSNSWCFSNMSKNQYNFILYISLIFIIMYILLSLLLIIILSQKLKGDYSKILIGVLFLTMVNVFIFTYIFWKELNNKTIVDGNYCIHLKTIERGYINVMLWLTLGISIFYTLGFTFFWWKM